MHRLALLAPLALCLLGSGGCDPKDRGPPGPPSGPSEPAGPSPLEVLGAPLPTSGPLLGWVDMHTHPMAHLGFGGKLLHGAPDIGAIVPAGMRTIGGGCNPEDEVATNPAMALGSCTATHSGDFFANSCADQVRNEVVKGAEAGLFSFHGPNTFGWPGFDHWPRHNNITHQQMWIEWVERAWLGGQRVMVALAVNNRTMAQAINGPLARDDDSTLRRQIAETKAMAERHDWMEIAYSADDLVRIVRRGDLAIVLGVEVDEIGNFSLLNRVNPGQPTDRMIRDAIDDLYRLGVRYIFPLHIVDNVFGGAAVYEGQFNTANRYQWNRWWDLECDASVDLRVEFGFDLLIQSAAAARLEIGFDEVPPIPACPPGEGHRNRRGLQRRGEVALRHMMQRGMLIDIDHTSRRTLDDIFALNRTLEYPLASGHNGPPRGPRTENMRTPNDYRLIGASGGMAGVGYDGIGAAGYVDEIDGVRGMGARAVALGTDMNGLVAAPGPGGPGAITYDDDWPPAGMSSTNRTWDYNIEGVSHYGLLPDFLKDVGQRDADVLDQLMLGADRFAGMWRKAEALAGTIPQDVPLRAGGEECDWHGDCASGVCVPSLAPAGPLDVCTSD